MEIGSQITRVEGGAIGIGATAGANLIQEFFIRKVTHNVPNNDPDNDPAKP